MDAGGRSIASLDRGISDLLDRVVPRRFPWLRVAWELPVPILLQLVQHEGFGHGARARELGLHARYGIGLDSAWTDIDESPASNEDLSLIVAGGTEADSVLARRLLLDMYQGRGGPAGLVPFLLMAKTDFPIYVGDHPATRRIGHAVARRGRSQPRQLRRPVRERKRHGVLAGDAPGVASRRRTGGGLGAGLRRRPHRSQAAPELGRPARDCRLGRRSIRLSSRPSSRTSGTT